MRKTLPQLLKNIRACTHCADALPCGPRPVVLAHKSARLPRPAFRVHAHTRLRLAYPTCQDGELCACAMSRNSVCMETTHGGKSLDGGWRPADVGQSTVVGSTTTKANNVIVLFTDFGLQGPIRVSEGGAAPNGARHTRNRLVRRRAGR